MHQCSFYQVCVQMHMHTHGFYARRQHRIRKSLLFLSQFAHLLHWLLGGHQHLLVFLWPVSLFLLTFNLVYPGLFLILLEQCVHLAAYLCKSTQTAFTMKITFRIIASYRKPDTKYTVCCNMLCCMVIHEACFILV